jgi:glycine dehydrogenase
MPISYAFIKMMGPVGLFETSRQAILNANYMMTRLEKDNAYDVKYKGDQGRCAHEFIIDVNKFK